MRPLIVLPLAAGALAATAALALADTTVAPDATVQNVTTYGTTSAWSRKADDGYHLVVDSAGKIADAPVPASKTPYDPDLGPTSSNGRMIVYARDGDIYQYLVGSSGEQKLPPGVSSPRHETAPAYFKGILVFSRTGSGAGTFLQRPGKVIVRLTTSPAAEADVNQTRVVGRFGSGRNARIAIYNFDATSVRTVARSTSGDTVASPTLTRFNAIWLARQSGGTAVRETGVNAHRGLKVRQASRALPASATSLSSTSIPALYTDDRGVQQIAPKLTFK